MKPVLLLLAAVGLCFGQEDGRIVQIPDIGSVRFPSQVSAEWIERELNKEFGFRLDTNTWKAVVVYPRKDIFDEVAAAKTKPASPPEQTLRLKGVAPPAPVVERATQPDPLRLWAVWTLIGTALVFAVWAALRRMRPLAADAAFSLSLWFPRWWADTRVSLGFVVGAAILFGWVLPRLYEPSFVSIAPDTSRVIYHHRRQWFGPTITTRLEARQERESRTFQWMAQGTKSGDWYVFFRDVD